MGLFQQRPEEEQNTWAGLPSEPVERDGVEHLAEAPSIDPMDIGLPGSSLFDIGVEAQYTTVVFPVAPPAPEAADAASGDAGDD